MPASPPTLVNDPAMLAYPGEWHQDSCRCSTHPVCRERRDDPPVSPADTIRRVREFLVDRHRAHLPTVEDGMLSELADLAAELLAVVERDKAALAAIRAEAERMVSEGCTEPSPEAFAYLASLRERHVEQIKALETKRERDRQHIARLTRGLEQIARHPHGGILVNIARAVLAGEEDA